MRQTAWESAREAAREWSDKEVWDAVKKVQDTDVREKRNWSTGHRRMMEAVMVESVDRKK